MIISRALIKTENRETRCVHTLLSDSHLVADTFTNLSFFRFLQTCASPKIANFRMLYLGNSHTDRSTLSTLFKN